MAGGGGSIRKKLITRLLYTNEYIYYLCPVFLTGRAGVSALFLKKNGKECSVLAYGNIL